jgi:VWFA-related protein
MYFRRGSLRAIACLAACAALLAAQEGPQTGSGESVAKPRKPAGESTDTTAGPKIPSKFEKNKNGPPEDTATFRSEGVTVSVDIAILDNKGNFIPGIPRGNFRVLEDSVPQQISTFSLGEAPMTVAMIVEFSGLFQQYYTSSWFQTLTASWGFLDTLKPEDYIAIVAYDMHTEILCDFTTDKKEAYQAMRRLQAPGFSEANLFDALSDTAKRMQDIEGRKAIVLVSSGIDTFSKTNFDKTRKTLQEAGVPVYAIGLMQTMRELADAYGGMGALQRMDFLQADNEMSTFAKETGGKAFFPRFNGEFPSIFSAISEALRHQYTITYVPNNQARDGKFRKIKVDLVNPQGEPLKITVNGKPVKYQILAKAGYTAPRVVE